MVDDVEEFKTMYVGPNQVSQLQTHNGWLQFRSQDLESSTAISQSLQVAACLALQPSHRTFLARRQRYFDWT